VSDLAYFVEVSDPFGVKLAQVDSFLALDFVRPVNDVGVLTLDLDPNTNTAPFRLDARLGVWRQGPAGGFLLQTETVWFVRQWRRVMYTSGERVLRITAYSASDLLARRIIAYAAGSAQASKTDNADDMMKAIVRENLGASATDTDRRWSSYLTVQSDSASASSMSKAFSRRNVLTTLQEIGETSAEAGEPLYFDIMVPTPGGLEFRTYTGQRGTDRTLTGAAPLVISPELGTISGGELFEDYASEYTVVYAAGQGEKDYREVSEVEDTARSGASPFGRIEALRDARHGATGASLTAEGNAYLRASRPKRIFTAALVDTPQVRYGLEWHWGDKVTAQFEGKTFDCHIDTLRVSVAGGKETISAHLRAEEPA
jgi:hypothetical protein